MVNNLIFKLKEKLLMNKIFGVLLSCLIFVSCNKIEQMDNISDDNRIGINSVYVQARTGDGESFTEETSFFKVGDMIIIEGASEDDIVFKLIDIDPSDDVEDLRWRSDKDYYWKESPSTVYAYYGKDTFIKDKEQFPEILYASINEIPENGILDFTGKDKSFKHKMAMVEVRIEGWSEFLEPTVELRNLHKIIAVTAKGEFKTDDLQLSSIALEKKDKEGDCLVYSALVPYGTEEEPNILPSYELMVNDLNILTFQPDEDLIPKYYESNKKYTFRLNYVSSRSGKPSVELFLNN